MKKILMILQSEFPPDIRLEKEIRSLASEGYSVTVICNQYMKNLNPEYPHCSIERVKAIFKNKALNKVINFPIFFNPRFLFKIYSIVIKFKPDSIHAHDLPMAPLGLFFGKLFGLNIVLDMHENYPAALKAFQKKGILNFIFKNYRAAKILEEFCLKRADRIITVIEENSERISKLGVQSEKIFVVSNTVDLDTFARGKVNPHILQKYHDNFVLLYTGFITPERGLDTVVKAMSYLKSRLPKVKLLLVGNGLSTPSLKQIVSDEKTEEIIEFIPWPGHENLGSYLDIADIGISPQPYNEHWNNSIPHKLFEYMSQSIPVLVTNALPLKRIITETSAGLFYESDNPKDLAKKIMEIYESKVNFGENGLKSVREKYNWQRDAKVLIKMYNDLSIKSSS